MEGQLFLDQLLQTGDVYKSYTDKDYGEICWVEGFNGKAHPIVLDMDYNSKTRSEIKWLLGIKGRRS